MSTNNTNEGNNAQSNTNLTTNETQVRETLNLSTDFDAKVQDAQMRTKALQFITTLLSGNPSSNEKQEAIFNIASNEQQRVLDLGKGFNVRLKDLKLTNEGNEVADIIQQLSKDFDRINPGKIDWTNAPRKGMRKIISKIPFFGNAISSYWEQYENVMTTINENIGMLNGLLDKKEKDILIINEKKDIYLESMASYFKAIQQGIVIKEVLEQKIAEETDEAKQRFMQENWLYPLGKRILTLQELYLSSFDAAISAELIARGHRELITDLREKNKVATLRLQTGVWLAAELYDQKRMLESGKALRDTNKKLADTVHSMLGTYQQELQQQATSSFQEFDQWKAHMEQTTKLYEDAKQFRVNAIPVLNSKITEFATLMELLKGYM